MPISLPLARVALSAALLLTLLGCATNDPYRDSTLAWNGQTVSPRPDDCDTPYYDTDDLIWQELNNHDGSVDTRDTLNERVAGIISPQLNGANSRLSRCWKTSYEDHENLEIPRGAKPMAYGPPPGYDLLLAEFDDQGERADVAVAGARFGESEVALIAERLDALLEEELRKTHNRGGLNVVVFTFGWHGSASATDDYSIWFKAILEEVARLEATSRRSKCASGSGTLRTTADKAEQTRVHAELKSYACSPEAADSAIRRTVGIEIAWRGDSETIPLLKYGNFWDRKNAAQTVAQGAVRDLLSRIHEFYMAHSCHSSTATHSPSANTEPCDAVHLLTIGHSFGGLIDYHTLNGDLSSGVLGGGRSHRAYGYGDLTVLLNPAFEGEREVTLEDAALTRADPYPTNFAGRQTVPARDIPEWPSGAQLPMLVTLQSKGDWATHYAFPFARLFSGAFEETPGAGEYVRSLKAAGWISTYQTHTLTPGHPNEKDSCIGMDSKPAWFCPFDMKHEENRADPLVLTWTGPTSVPEYFPLWTVAVHKSIMDGHDDISNPTIVRFIAQLFRAAYEQSEVIHERARQNRSSQ